MFQTFEAITDEHGNIRLKEPIRIPAGRQVLVTILDKEPDVETAETLLLSEAALAEDWNNHEEDKAWSYLQKDQSF